MFNLIKRSILFIIIISVSGCSSTRTYTYNTSQREVICDKATTNIGNTIVLIETAWRSDQKEPMQRQQVALEEIEKAFTNFPCGNIDLPGGIKYYNKPNVTDVEMLKNFSNDGIDTVIIIRVEELTPRLEITFSIPFLWSGSNEADFRIKVVSVKTGIILTDMRVKRVTGGPFNIRPAEWSRAELNAALRSVIKKEY